MVEWDGALPERPRLRAGDELLYVVRAYDAAGNIDQTHARLMQLVRPEDAHRAAGRLRDDLQRVLGESLSVEQAQSRSLQADSFGANSLQRQTIPVYGSRVRVQGRNLAPGQSLEINGERQPIDREGRFVSEYLLPIGQHGFDLALREPGADAPTHQHRIDVDVSGRYLFAVGLADLTLSRRSVSGSPAGIAGDPRADDVISDGRLAFYAKARLAGRYLLTAQADTTERELKNLFDGFGQADPQDIFRRLDPDLYYPVYGDDSTTWRDVDTMGRFYLRMDWDGNQALWGNFQTGMSGTEYAQYVRSLYGAALDWTSAASTTHGDPVTHLRAFGAEAQSAPGHSEFIGTGGSLYYLRHTDILPGSEQVVLELRNPTTGRVEGRATLRRGVDYEMDDLQGRILLSRPLAQLVRENVPTLTRDTPLDGFEQRLLVDYEWVPSGFSSDEITAGLRARHWFGDHVGLGLTYVEENRAGQDYTLAAGDLTLRAGQGTYVTAEYSQTEAFSAPAFFSDNGGLSFVPLGATGPREGDARAIEARANLQELGWTEQPWSAGAWWREVSAGYSISRYDYGQAVTEHGAEVQGQIGDAIALLARYSLAERGTESLEQAQLTAEWRLDDARAWAGELRRVDEQRLAGSGIGTLGALRYTQRVGTALDLHATAQVTLDDDGGRYADNDALTLGGRYLFGEQSSIGTELTTGDRGDAVQVDAEHRIGNDHTVYGGYTHASNTSAYDSLFNPAARSGWTLGQRWRISSGVSMFNESQYLKTPQASGLADTFGMDFIPSFGWNLGFTLQSGDLTNAAGGEVDRRAVSVGGGHTSARTDWQSRVELRRDTGAERREQWVSTNRLAHRINESWRIAARLNYAETTDELDADAGARFIEGNLGFAWRPWNTTRWGLFGRYTYLYDLATLGQIGGASVDQRSQVVSLEGVYRFDQRWEFAGKAARREGEVRMGRGTGPWFDSATNFASGQIRYDLRQQWHALAEYRWIGVTDGGDNRGWLVGLDRDVGRNFRVGAGYNFTSFSDDLTDFDRDHRGWFINLVGTY